MTVADRQVLGGRYVLGEVLGAGGMATVWRATDRMLGRQVAVKVLSPQLAADPGFAARFEREARHAARLAHPRLVTVFDCGVDEGLPFIVMELAEGHTLRAILDQAGPLPPDQAVSIAAAVCEALEVAHSAALVHRDIKPANITLADGEVKVLDFGIARADGLSGGTGTRVVLGTAAYLSPEQACGNPVSSRSDLYSLGCVLFEMLTGVPPFAADSAVGLAYRHVHDDPGPPSARRPGLPPSLDAITARLLAKDPASRPASAAAARDGLLAALDADAPAGQLPGGSDFRAGRRGRRLSRAEVALAGALAAALAALAGLLVTGAPGAAAPAAASNRPAATHRSAPHISPRPSAHHSPRASVLPLPRASRLHSPRASARQTAKPRHSRRRHAAAAPGSGLPPTAAAVAAFVGDLQAGVADGQVAPPAGQDLYKHLQPLLFGPPDSHPDQVQQQYTQLVQSYQQHLARGEITGHAAVALRHALTALGTAIGAKQKAA